MIIVSQDRDDIVTFTEGCQLHQEGNCIYFINQNGEETIIGDYSHEDWNFMPALWKEQVPYIGEAIMRDVLSSYLADSRVKYMPHRFFNTWGEDNDDWALPWEMEDWRDSH